MFEGWMRADVISALALGVSGLALVASGIAAWYTGAQARLAKRKAREEETARQPAIEARLMAMSWPGWYRLTLTIRNRLDIAIVCENVRLRAPRGAGLDTYERAGVRKDSLGTNVFPLNPPQRAQLSREIPLDLRIAAKGATRTKAARTEGRTTVAIDRIHLDELLVFIPSTRSSRARSDLEASLSVRRINERDAFAESIVVTKIPPVSTSTDA